MTAVDPRATGPVGRRVVELSAGPITYDDTGGSGPALVLMHGLPMNGAQWRKVVPLLPDYRCIRPTMPLGAHTTAMHEDADLSQRGQALLLTEFLDALDLRDATLVLNDCGFGQFVISEGRDQRLARLVLVACEAFDNFPPGAAQGLATAMRVPGAASALFQLLRIRWVRRLPGGWRSMSVKRVADPVMDEWFTPARKNRAVRRDFVKFAVGTPDRATHAGMVTSAATLRPTGPRRVGDRRPLHAPPARRGTGPTVRRRAARRDRRSAHPRPGGPARAAGRRHPGLRAARDSLVALRQGSRWGRRRRRRSAGPRRPSRRRRQRNRGMVTMSFAVVYRWRVAAKDAELFVDRWRAATEALRERFGTFGSRLHRDTDTHDDTDDEWVAYAVWPSEDVYRAADTASLPEVAAMVALIPEPDRHKAVHLAVALDLLAPPPAGTASPS